MSNATLSWYKPMTSQQAERYHLCKGFVADELYDATLSNLERAESAIAAMTAERDALAAQLKAARDEQREADAKIAESIKPWFSGGNSIKSSHNEIADAIRKGTS